MEWGSTPNILVVSEAQKAKDSEETSTKEVQSIVNMLRKAETKIAKLGRDKTEKTARWLAYQKQMKAAFVTEEKRFQATQAKIAEDLVEAERQLVTAKELLAAAASEFRTVPTAAASGNSATAEEAWETMLRRTEAEEPPASREEIAEILRRYKRGEGLPTSPLPTFGRGPEPVPMETDGMNVDKASAPREAPTTNRAPHGDLSGPGGPSYGCASPSTGNARSTPYPEVPSTGPKLPTEPTREPPDGATRHAWDSPCGESRLEVARKSTSKATSQGPARTSCAERYLALTEARLEERNRHGPLPSRQARCSRRESRGQGTRADHGQHNQRHSGRVAASLTRPWSPGCLSWRRLVTRTQAREHFRSDRLPVPQGLETCWGRSSFPFATVSQCPRTSLSVCASDCHKWFHFVLFSGRCFAPPLWRQHIHWPEPWISGARLPGLPWPNQFFCPCWTPFSSASPSPPGIAFFAPLLTQEASFVQGFGGLHTCAQNMCIGCSGAQAMCTYRTLPTILVGDTSFVFEPTEVFGASSGHLHQPDGLALHAPDLTPSCSPRGSWGLVPSLPLGSAALPFLGVLPDSEGTCSLACFCQKLAPKRRIGGSGTSASYSGHKLFAALDLVGSFVVPFFSSLAVLAFSALLKMLFRQMPGRNSVVGRTLHIAFAAVPTDVSKGWQVGDAARGPLIPPSHGKHSPRRCTGHRQRSFTSPSWLAAILGFSVLPVCVWAAPDGLKEALTLATSTLQSLPESFGAGDRAAKDDSPFQGWVAEVLNGQACTQVAESPFPRHCAIIQTGFPTQHLLVYTHIPCEEPAFFQAAAELGLARYKDHDLVPTLPQLSDGLASLVAAPRWLAQTDKVVVVLDFSLWHGPVYSIIDWSFTTLASLASEARKYTNAPWHVYHAQQHSPIEEGVHVNAANGDVFYFVPVGAEPLHRPRFTDMLCDARLWSSYPQVVPREIIVPVWYALMSHVTRTPTYSGTSRSELQVVAADSFHSDASDLDFEYPLEDSPLQELVYRGQLVRGVLAARLWTPSKCRPGIFAFLDTRLIGLHPTFWFGSAGWIALEHFTDILAIRIPPGFRVDPAGVPCESGRVLVSDRCTIILSFVVDEALSASLSHTDPNAGAAGRDGNSVPSNPAVDLLQNSRAARRRAGHPSPDPEALLDARTRSEETDDSLRCVFRFLYQISRPRLSRFVSLTTP